MCITEIWTYRECGCQYHHPVPCHPCFNSALNTSRRRRVKARLSNTSSSSDHSPTSSSHSTFGNIDPLQRLGRECSIRHVVHKNFLEPICDDCLLEELGLQPELGPILGGRDLQEGLHGEEWILESIVEINVIEPEDDQDISSACGDYDDVAADADDEGEFRGSSGRRRGMDISRDALRISSDLSMDEQEPLPLLREKLRGAQPEGRKTARTVIKSQNRERKVKPRWSQQLRQSLSRKKEDRERPTSVSPIDDGSTDSSPPSGNSRTAPSGGNELEVGASSLGNNSQLWPDTLPEDARDDSLDTRDELVSWYDAQTNRNSMQDAQYQSWSQHLQADLLERHATADHLATSMLDRETLQQRQRSESSILSSPQTATPFDSASYPPPNLQCLSIPSCEFDNDATEPLSHPTTVPAAPSPPNTHTHTTSTDTTLSTSTFCTAYSSPSSPRQTTSTPSTRPTTAASGLNAPSQLSFHLLSTTLSITPPHRPTLTQRTSSLHSPPAPSPLLHSTPPLQQSPTSVFACVHERWAFRGCGCEGPAWVRSCVCDQNDESEDGDWEGGEGRRPGGGERKKEARGGDVEVAKEGCRATDPVVRPRWFFDEKCEACLRGDAA